MKSKWYNSKVKPPEDGQKCIVQWSEDEMDFATAHVNDNGFYWDSKDGTTSALNMDHIWMPAPIPRKEQNRMKQTRKYILTKKLFEIHPELLDLLDEDKAKICKLHFCESKDYDKIDAELEIPSGNAKKTLGASERKLYTEYLEILCNMKTLPRIPPVKLEEIVV
jgi:hypothetical protein